MKINLGVGLKRIVNVVYIVSIILAIIITYTTIHGHIIFNSITRETFSDFLERFFLILISIFVVPYFIRRFLFYIIDGFTK